MPGWSFHSARRLGRSIGVWFAWVVLTGRLTHGGSYGELKRVETGVVVRQLALLALTAAVVGYVAIAIPTGVAAWVGSGLLLGGGSGLIVVGVYLAVTWYADYSLGQKGTPTTHWDRRVLRLLTGTEGYSDYSLER